SGQSRAGEDEDRGQHGDDEDPRGQRPREKNAPQDGGGECRTIEGDHTGETRPSQHAAPPYARRKQRRTEPQGEDQRARGERIGPPRERNDAGGEGKKGDEARERRHLIASERRPSPEHRATGSWCAEGTGTPAARDHRSSSANIVSG